MSTVDRLARAVYESHKLVRPWDHPRTKEIWHESCQRTARAVLREMNKIKRERRAALGGRGRV